jgi:hypothetical protein
MKFLVSFVLSFFLVLPIYAALDSDDFQQNFYIAKQHLSQRRIKKALPYLLYLHEHYPENDNLKYLIGVCYAEEKIVHPKTIELLKTAAKKASLSYDPNSLYEERVPIYVYYYLCIAYAQNGMCADADSSRNKFLKRYPHKDQYYVIESSKWVEQCHEYTEPAEKNELPSFPDFKPYVSKKEAPTTEEEIIAPDIDTLAPDQPLLSDIEKPAKKIITKRLEYSTNYPLFGVQLGAFNEVIPVSRFKDMKNVDAFMDKDGLIRYVIGHFSINSQAEALLKQVREKGFEDAFIVNVNKARFSEEVISVNNVNIKADFSNQIEYRVQIGAFREKIPEKTVGMYFLVDGIREIKDGGLTFLTVGKFKSYQEAKALEKEIKTKNIKDAFVIALMNGKKISLQQANDLKNEPQ